MARREDDEDNGFTSNVRYNVDHCLVDHEAMFGMIAEESEQEKLLADFRNYDNNPRDDIPGPISFMGRGNGRFSHTNNGNDGIQSSLYPTMNSATQQLMMNKKNRKQPTTTELQHWKEMRNLVEEKGQSKFLSSLKQIQENRTGTAKDKIPLLPVIVRQILHYDSHESAHVVVGEIGSDMEMEGTISRKAIERNPSILTVGTVVLLKKIQLYCPRPAKFHLIISEKNTAKVWTNDTEEANKKLKVEATPLSSAIRVTNEDMDSFGPNIDSMDSTPPSGDRREEPVSVHHYPATTAATTARSTTNPTLANKPQHLTSTEKFVPPPQAFLRPPQKPATSNSTTPPNLNSTNRFRPPPPHYETPETPKSNDSNLLPNEFEFSQPLLTTPSRSNHSNHSRSSTENLSPELLSTTTSTKRKFHPPPMISSQSSIENDMPNKKRKQLMVAPSLDPINDLSQTPGHFQKDSFNDPLFDENSNQSTPMSYSPPLFQEQRSATSKSPSDQAIPLFNAALSSVGDMANSLHKTPSPSSTSGKSVLPPQTMVGTTTLTTNREKTLAATTHKVTMPIEDDDPLKGIIDDDDEILIHQKERSVVNMTIPNIDHTRSAMNAGTARSSHPPTAQDSHVSVVNNTSTHERIPQLTNKTLGMGFKLAQLYSSPTKKTKPTVNFDDDNDDPLKDILGDDDTKEQSLFQEAPLHQPVSTTVVVGKLQQPTKKVIAFDDEDF
ncbi:hypothetical protein C9374_012482 [Naegleria lovaniensis]|uniref:Homologous recombination OB-fold protein OB-fold domain-containing protein n=1 Tax=Naegleria lovaniensis TaxID=51637 RepID=A0AA88KVZ8_NAELO|nr:uncharacterized protein C9374_012482 [Naegleria lovaniensis]KAG2392230.1 hypothetical protein C9374_012482 [Naegleria lovaniensis]